MYTFATLASSQIMPRCLYLASDSLGSDLRESLKAHLQAQHPDYQVKDLGNFDKYYEGAYKV